MNNLYFSDRSVTYAQFLDDVSRKVACLVEKRLDERLKERQQADLVTTEEAARILGITPDRLRHIKNRFPHVKGGVNQQGKLLFRRDALLASY